MPRSTRTCRTRWSLTAAAQTLESPMARRNATSSGMLLIDGDHARRMGPIVGICRAGISRTAAPCARGSARVGAYRSMICSVPPALIAEGLYRFTGFALCPVSMSHAGHHGTVVDVTIRHPLDDQETRKPSLHARQRMVHD